MTFIYSIQSSVQAPSKKAGKKAAAAPKKAGGGGAAKVAKVRYSFCISSLSVPNTM